MPSPNPPKVVKVIVQVLLLDDLVRASVLLGGHLVGGETTWCLTRLVVDVSVDGGVRDADV